MPLVPRHLRGGKLTYYIFEGVLGGRAGGNQIHRFALSCGGGRYNTKVRAKSTHTLPIQAESTNNPHGVGLKTTRSVRAGANGSDGCIVPTRPTDFQDLMAGLEKDGGGMLFVEESMEGWRFA